MIRIVLLLCALSTGVALANAPSQALAQQGKKAPSTAPVRPSSIDELFERLQRSKTEEEAKGIADAIQRRWMRSGSDTADLLMDRALDALKAGDQPLSVELLDRVVTLQPGWAEGWNKRATVFFMMGDNTRSMADLRETLAREPRHFGALAGLGMILRTNGDDKRAYDAFKRALAINPHMAEVKSAVERLAPDYEGRDI
ncbi:MAG: tetratricopeptide repeat protein [Burkholderiales bacterium]|nr:tetratricopeptide repeat protein [Burkholderiales bacterium]